MSYYNQPDNKLHFIDHHNTTAVDEIYNNAEDKISYLLSSLG